MIDRSILPFARVEDGQGELYSHSGSPVWPVQCDEDIRHLETVARVFGATLRCVEPDRTGHLERSGTVGYLASDCEAEARLYAHLTSRRPTAWSPSASSAPLPDVIVISRLRLDLEFLEWIWERDLAPAAIGLIVCDRPPTGRRTVLARAAAAWLTPAVDLRLVDLFAQTPLASVDLGNRRVLGAGADVTELRRALSARAGVVSVLTHGDGLDIALGRTAVPRAFCPLKDAPARSEEQPTANCEITNHCGRLKLPMADALRDARTFGVHELEARILVMFSCYTLRPHRWHDSRDRNAGNALVDSPHIGALLASWDVMFGGGPDFETLVLALARGVPVGRALAQFRRRESARSRRIRLCLFGDPRTRLPPIADNASRHPPLGRVAEIEGPQATNARRRGLLSSAAAIATKAEASRAPPTAPFRIDLMPANEPAPAERLVEWIRLHLHVLQTWTPFFARPEGRRGQGTTCPFCDRTGTEFRFAPLVARHRPRRFLSCVSCTAAVDAPIGGPEVSMQLRRTPDGLTAMRVEAPWDTVRSVHRIVQYPRPVEATVRSWSPEELRRANEEEARWVPVPADLEETAGESQLVLFTVFDDDFVYLHTTLRDGVPPGLRGPSSSR